MVSCPIRRYGARSKLLEIDPKDIDTLEGIALDLTHLGNYSQAVVYFDRVLAIDPYRMNVLLDKGNALNNLSKYNEAIFSFDKVLDTYPDQDKALNGKGTALFELGKYADAIKYFDRVLTMNSSDNHLTNEAMKNKIMVVRALENAEKFNTTR